MRKTASLLEPYITAAALHVQGTTALQAAAREGWVEVVAVLAADPECQVNSMDVAGRVALHWAAAYGHVAVVNELWCRSANVQQIDHGGWTGVFSSLKPSALKCLCNITIAPPERGWW